jgi:hypothetical protein
MAAIRASGFWVPGFFMDVIYYAPRNHLFDVFTTLDLSMFNLDNKSGLNLYLISFLHTMYDTPELRYLPLAHR